MTPSIKTLSLIVILTTILCDHTSPTQIDTNTSSDSEVKHLTPIKCKKYSFELQLESLKQWKRRRRINNAVLLIKTGQRGRRNAVEEFVVTKSAVKDFGINSMSYLVRFKQEWPVGLWKRYLFSDEYLILINSHWLKFSPPSDAVNYVLGGFYMAMMAIGCSGNGLVLLMYFKCRTLRTPGNILVANLALSDFIMLAKTPIFIFNSFNLGPALGKTGCIIYGFLGGMTGCTSIATLAAIALDRYWAIVRPLEGLSALTALRAKFLAIGAWLYAGIFSSIPAMDIGYGRYVPEGYLTSCSFDYLTEEFRPRLFIFIFFCAAWVAPFGTITFCYLNIFRVVVCKRNISLSKTKNDNRLSSRHVKEQAKRKAEVKLAILVIGVIALFFVSWTPYAIVTLLGIFGNKELLTPTASMIPALFCKTAACINPFVYIITHPKFRKEFKSMLFKDKSRRSDGTLKTIGYTEATAYHRQSKDSSETDVEVVEMKDIPYQTKQAPSRRGSGKVKTLSGKVTEREDSQRSISMKSFEGDVVQPPSWYAKPKFGKKKSFHRRSTQSVVSFNADPPS